MTYAHVTADTVTEGRLPKAARRLDTQAWVLGLADAPTELREACGWYTVTDVPRPADDTQAYDRTVELVNGTPTVVWTARPFTVDELSARTASVNDTTLRDRAAAALVTNRAFLADDSLTNADVVAQVKALTRQVSGIARLVIGQTADVD